MRGSWSYVPFILEDCGLTGVHALAFLETTLKVVPDLTALTGYSRGF